MKKNEKRMVLRKMKTVIYGMIIALGMSGSVYASALEPRLEKKDITPLPQKEMSTPAVDDGEKNHDQYILESDTIKEKYRVLQQIDNYRKANPSISDDFYNSIENQVITTRRYITSLDNVIVRLDTSMEKHQLQMLQMLQKNASSYIGNRSFHAISNLARLNPKITAIADKNNPVELTYDEVRSQLELVNLDSLTVEMSRISERLHNTKKTLRTTNQHYEGLKIMQQVEEEIDLFMKEMEEKYR